MVQRSVCTKLEEVFSQGITRVLNAEGSVDTRNDTILCSCLASKRKRNITDTLVENAVRENIFIALNSHYECTEVEISFWTGLVPHLGHDLMHVLHSLEMQFHTLIHQVSISVTRAIKHLQVALNQFVALRLDCDVHQNKTGLVSAAIKHSDVLNVIFHKLSFRRQEIFVIICYHFGLRVISEPPVV